MLNNDLKSLIKQYKRYKKQKRFDSFGKIVAWILIPILLITVFLKFQNTITKETATDIKTEVTKTTQIIQSEENNKSKHIIEIPIPKEIKKPTQKESIKDENLQRLLSYYTKRKSYSSTMSIASYYYSYQEYENAVKWAIRASKINKNKDQPWIIYAKSKSALGNEMIAKKALETYLKFNESIEAQILLKTLENNTTK